jgi:ketosteroid isomerase-like protein
MNKTMRYCVLAFALFGFSLTFAQEDVEAVRKIMADQVNEWNAGRVEGYMKGYWESDSTVFVSGGTLTRGYGNVLSRYRKSYNTREKMGWLEFSELLLRPLSEKVVVATGMWKLIRKNDQPWGRFTLVIEKKPEGWRIVYDHTSAAN